MRTCIFCGGTPLTREHVWPQWVTKLFDTTSVVVTRSGAEPLRYRNRSIELTAAVVCAGCNNGWMSALERAVRPLLLPMIEGTPTALDAAAQRTVAAWATKTAMVFEHTLSLPASDVYWSNADRAAFSAPPHEPPGADTLVRIAAYAVTPNRLAFGHAGATQLATIAGRDRGPAGTRATLGIGGLILQVEAHRWRDATGNMGFWWPPQFGKHSEWIWPVQHAVVHWPTGEPLDAEQADAFARM